MDETRAELAATIDAHATIRTLTAERDTIRADLRSMGMKVAHWMERSDEGHRIAKDIGLDLLSMQYESRRLTQRTTKLERAIEAIEETISHAWLERRDINPEELRDLLLTHDGSDQ